VRRGRGETRPRDNRSPGSRAAKAVTARRRARRLPIDCSGRGGTLVRRSGADLPLKAG
jgi:hypothetical protein